MRRTSGQLALVCALAMAGMAAAPAWAKPAKNQASGKASAKVRANPASKKQAGKNSNANTSTASRKGKSADKKIAGNGKTKNKTVAAAKRAEADAPSSKSTRNSKQAATHALTAQKRGKGNSSDTLSSSNLRKQIAALQAKGKGRQLSKNQKQQLARLTAQAQQAEKNERLEKMEQARALRLAAAQKAKQRQSVTVARTEAAEPRSLQTAQHISPPTQITPVQQEDLAALQTHAAPLSDTAAPATATAAGIATTSSTTTAVAATEPADPLQALLDAKQDTVSASTTAAAPVPSTAPIVISRPATNPVTAPAPMTAAVPATAVATAPVVVRKPEPTAPLAPSPIIRVSVPQRDSLGQIQGLSPSRSSNFGPDLHSSVAFAMDQRTGQVLLNKNGHFILPIASITKVMTAVITMDANLPMDEMITITEEDIDRIKGSRSRLAVGTTLSRQQLLHLALMSSENRAAHALGRTYPGGLSAAIRAMNKRALLLGMRETNFVEPTGLSSANRSSAHDLALLVKAAYRYPLIRNYTTHSGAEFAVQGQMLRYNNTNRLIHSPEWNIGLQKTGFISEAGRCVVMQSNIGGRNVIIVLLDSSSNGLRAQDAEAIRYWVQQDRKAPARDSSIIAQARIY